MAQFLYCEHDIGFYYSHARCAVQDGRDYRIVFTSEIANRETPCIECGELLVAEQPESPLPVTMLDCLIHSDERPFCGDETCPCHNEAAYQERIAEPLQAGLLTEAEAVRLYVGRQL